MIRKDKRLDRALRPDAQAFDEIRIVSEQLRKKPCRQAECCLTCSRQKDHEACSTITDKEQRVTMKPRKIVIKAVDAMSSQAPLCIHEGGVRHKIGGYNYPLAVGRVLGQAEPGEDVEVEVYPDVLHRIEWHHPGTVPQWLFDALDAPCSCGSLYITNVPLDGSDNIVCADCGAIPA